MNFVKASAKYSTQLAIFVNSDQCMSHHFGGSANITPIKYTSSYQNTTCFEETMALIYVDSWFIYLWSIVHSSLNYVYTASLACPGCYKNTCMHLYMFVLDKGYLHKWQYVVDHVIRTLHDVSLWPRTPYIDRCHPHFIKQIKQWAVSPDERAKTIQYSMLM